MRRCITSHLHALKQQIFGEQTNFLKKLLVYFDSDQDKIVAVGAYMTRNNANSIQAWAMVRRVRIACLRA